MPAPPASTLFVALHGELASHPWRDRPSVESDAYSLFVARSSAMGWLTEAADGAVGGVWGMSDAGLDSDSGSLPPRVAWFQVSFPGRVPAGTPLPVQQFLSCAGEVLERVGVADLRAVQILLPLQALDPSAGSSPRARAVMPLLQDAGWFADCDPRRRTQVRVTVDGGQDPSVRATAPEIFRWMREFPQDVFSCDTFSLTDEDDGIVLKPAVDDGFWGGPPRHRFAFRGALAEWSLDALGWLAAFVAEAGAGHGVGTPVILTASTVRPRH